MIYNVKFVQLSFTVKSSMNNVYLNFFKNDLNLMGDKHAKSEVMVF